MNVVFFMKYRLKGGSKKFSFSWSTAAFIILDSQHSELIPTASQSRGQKRFKTSVETLSRHSSSIIHFSDIDIRVQYIENNPLFSNRLFETLLLAEHLRNGRATMW